MGEKPYTDYGGKLEIMRNVANLMADVMNKKIVAIIIEENHENHIGTGICIKLGTHYFIATAAHVVEPKGKLMFVCALSSEPLQNVFLRETSDSYIPLGRNLPFKPNVVASKRCDLLDLAYLEIEELEQAEFLGLDDLSTETLECLAFVNGHPSEYIKPIYIKPISEEGRSLIRISFLGVPIKPNDPNYPTSCADSRYHIVVSWPKNILIPHSIRGTLENVELPEPHGMSGGGIWLVDTNLERLNLWTKESTKLAGINTDWSRSMRYVKGIKINHWLSFISENYSDIKPLIENWLNSRG